MAGKVGSRFSRCNIRYVNGPSAMEAPMREDAVSDKFFYRVIEIYSAAERDFLRDAFEGMKDRPPQSDRELNDWLATDRGKTGHDVCAGVDFVVGRSRSVITQAPAI